MSALLRIFFLNPKQRDGHSPPPLVYEGGWLLTSSEEEVGAPSLSLQSEPEPDNAEEIAVVPSGHSDYGAVSVDGLQKRNRSGEEDTGRDPHSGSTGGTGRYVVRKGKSAENQQLLLEKSSDNREL